MRPPTGIRIVGNKCQMRIKRNGAWEWEATGVPSTQPEMAAKVRAQTQAIIDGGNTAMARPGAGTVRAFATQWLEARKNLSADDDEGRLTNHVIKHKLASGRVFGDLTMKEVRPIHARAIIRAVIAKGLAPRTVLNVNSIARQMFLDAVADEVLTYTPWVVPRKELPLKRDNDPKFRAGAIFTKAELAVLLFDERVPHDRRVLWALMYLGGLRFGEAAALRWSDRETFAGYPALHIHGSFSTKRRTAGATKTQSVRMMPEHPTLAAILDHWRHTAFREFFKRDAVDSDLIVPSRMGVHRSKNHSLHKLHEDLDRLKLRVRRQHDLRRSFVSHAVDDGAEKDRLAPLTHGRGTSVMDQYDTAEWKKCRREAMKLDFPLPMGMPWGDFSKEAAMDETSTNRSGGAGNRIRFPLHDGSGTDDTKSGTSTRDYRRRSPLFRPVQVTTIPNVPTAARLLLDACDGDVDAAITAVRSARRKRASR